MMKTFGLLLGMALIITGYTNAQSIKTIFIHPHKVACTGVGPSTCMQYRNNTNESWKLMYGEIKGFTHVEGTSYKLKIKEIKLKNVPADGSSIERELVSILESKPYAFIDLKNLNHKWNISQMMIDGSLQNVQTFGYSLQVKDSLLSAKICNSFSGVVQISESGAFKALPMRSTKMMCIQINHESSFVQAINTANAIQVNNGILQLLDADNKVLLEATLPSTSGPIPPAFTDYAAKLDQTKYNVQLLHDENGKTDISESKAFIQFDLVNKRASGKGGCNNFFAQVETLFSNANSGTIKFSKAGSTMMACPSFMDTERMFLQLLEKADNFEMNGNNFLLKQGAAILITLQAAK